MQQDTPVRGRPFQPGQVANPRGRPKGSRHKLSEKFLADLCAHWDEVGPSALERAVADDPAAYCRIVASLLPKQSEKFPNPLSGLTDDELRKLDAWLDALRSEDDGRPDSEGGNPAPSAGE